MEVARRVEVVPIPRIQNLDPNGVADSSVRCMVAVDLVRRLSDLHRGLVVTKLAPEAVQLDWLVDCIRTGSECNRQRR
jgi:hypothetical protein